MTQRSLWQRLVEKLEVQPNGCWLWRGAIGKRQRGGLDGRIRKGRRHEGFVSPHRQMLIFAKGEPPTPAHQACHRCPGGPHELCCNPTHLYWGTQSENEADKRRSADA